PEKCNKVRGNAGDQPPQPADDLHALLLVARSSPLIGNLEPRLLINELLVLAEGVDRLGAFGQGGLVEQGKKRCQPLAVDQAEHLNVALRGDAPAGNGECPARLRQEAVVPQVVSVYGCEA